MGLFKNFRIRLQQQPQQPMKANPKVKAVPWSIAPLYTASKLADFEKYYKTTSLVRHCINLRAAFATSKGFFTEIMPLGDKEPEEFIDIKREVDEMNRRIDLDRIVYISEIKRIIYGYAAFEIVKDGSDKIMRLIPLRSALIEPTINEETWELQKYTYDSTPIVDLEPEEVFFISNDALEGDPRGLSEVEPIVSAVKQKMELDEDILAAAMRLWAPFVVATVDTSAMTEEEEDVKLKEVKDAIEPGASIVSNKDISFQVVHMTPDLQSLMLTRQNVDEEIIGNFGMPKGLLGREKTMNRATLEFSLKALRDGVIARSQRTLKRVIEAQLYDPIVKQLGRENEVRIKHVWNPISLQDFVDIAKPVSDLYSNRIIDKRTAYDLLNLDLLLVKAEEAVLTKGRRPPKQQTIDEFAIPEGGEMEVKLV